jgi:hypothetical protein
VGGAGKKALEVPKKIVVPRTASKNGIVILNNLLLQATVRRGYMA